MFQEQAQDKGVIVGCREGINLCSDRFQTRDSGACGTGPTRHRAGCLPDSWRSSNLAANAMWNCHLFPTLRHPWETLVHQDVHSDPSVLLFGCPCLGPKWSRWYGSTNEQALCRTNCQITVLMVYRRSVATYVTLCRRLNFLEYYCAESNPFTYLLFTIIHSGCVRSVTRGSSYRSGPASGCFRQPPNR